MRLRVRFPLSAEYVCRVAGHDLRHTYVGDYEAKHYCIRCGGEWPMPSPKESLHRDRRDMRADCITLSECTEEQHTNEWPCDFS